MKKLWCSLWRTFLNAFNDAVDGVAYAIDTLTTPVLNLLSGVGEVVGDVIDDVGNAIGGVFTASPILLLVVGMGLVFFATKDGGKEKQVGKGVEPYGSISV